MQSLVRKFRTRKCAADASARLIPRGVAIVSSCVVDRRRVLLPIPCVSLFLVYRCVLSGVIPSRPVARVLCMLILWRRIH
eukprot:362819-Chlamydomonas_euryale.AAC.4